MRSPGAALLGKQEPRVHHAPTAKWSDGDDACFLATSYGLEPDPWQQLVVTAWLGRRADGKYAAGRCGLAVPRQNGKNGVLEIVELFKMVVEGRKILHTAHEIKTARKAFLRIRSFFENPKYPELAKMVDWSAGGIRQTNGQEAIFLTNGGSIEFVARTRGSGRGFTVDDLVIDEAQELTDEQLEALLPTISAAPSGDPQQIYTGTPPGPNASGEVWRRVRTAGVKGKDKRLAFDEWSPDPATMPSGPEDLAAVKALVAATNPALGRRLHMSVALDELGSMSWEGFLRERCGQWDDEESSGVIPAKPWGDRATKNPPLEGRTSYAVKFSPDGSTVSLGVALRPDDGGPVHVELIEHRSMREGTAWLVAFLVGVHKQAAQIVVDGRAHAGALVNDLREAGVPARVIIAPQTGQVIAANAMLLDAVVRGTITHYDDPLLNDCATHAGRRTIGDASAGGWGFKSLGTYPAEPVDCIALAHWAARTSKRRPGRKTRGAVLA